MSEAGFETVSETAERLGITVSLVRRYCRAGRLAAEKLGRDWMVYEGAVKDSLKKATKEEDNASAV